MSRPILEPRIAADRPSHEGPAVPVTLLTGFLGAGKTTLLNRILNGDHGLRVGVMVNDFGAINIDAELVSGVEQNTISLTNGCVCCEIRDDLVQSIETLLGRVDQGIDYIIVEASGVADPESIVMTFVDRRYESILRLDSVTCVIDTSEFLQHFENTDLTLLKMRQLGFADLVILNKVDLAGHQMVAAVRAAIDHSLNRVRMVESAHCDVPLEILLAVGRFDPTSELATDNGMATSPSRGGTHSSMFQTYSYESTQPIQLSALRTAVRRHLPATVYRCKGILFAVEHPTVRVAIQTVGRRSTISELDPWADRRPRTRLIAIAAPGEIDDNELTAALDACLSTI